MNHSGVGECRVTTQGATAQQATILPMDEGQDQRAGNRQATVGSRPEVIMAQRRAAYQQREPQGRAGQQSEIAVSTVADHNCRDADGHRKEQHRQVPVRAGKLRNERQRDQDDRQRQAMHNAKGRHHYGDSVDIRILIGCSLSHGNLRSTGQARYLPQDIMV